MMVGDPTGVEQWCLRAPARKGEAVRLALIAEGTLDRSLKIRRDGTHLLLPLRAWREGAERCVFEPHPEHLHLPAHEIIGGIAIMQDPDPEAAERILESRPNLHTVLAGESEVEGEYRTKRFAVLAGTPTTRTMVVEHGCRFSIDLSAAFFSARLATERQRIAALARNGEKVLDMFSGVGPFAIVISRHTSLIVAADINPQAITLMLENIALNHAGNIIPVLADTRRLTDILPWKFDRIVMNLPKTGQEFLREAFLLCRLGGTIHFYALVAAEGQHRARIEALGGEILAERVVRSYSPAQWHAVYDIRKTGE